MKFIIGSLRQPKIEAVKGAFTKITKVSPQNQPVEFLARECDSNIPTKGPTYESATEVKMLQRLGADAGTMSTVPEVIAAVSRGIKVLGMSCITNLGT